MKFSRSAVTAGSANAVVARLQNIIDAATANLDALGDHGVTAEKLKALKQKLKVYDTLRVLPRNAIGVAAAATKALDRLFPRVDRLLHNQIDRLMWQFRATAPEFYDKYRTARVIVGPSTPTPEGEPAGKSKATTAAKTSAATTAAPNTAPATPCAASSVQASEPASTVRNGTPAVSAPETKSA